MANVFRSVVTGHVPVGGRDTDMYEVRIEHLGEDDEIIGTYPRVFSAVDEADLTGQVKDEIAVINGNLSQSDPQSDNSIVGKTLDI